MPMIEKLLPHRSPMVMIDSVEGTGADSARALRVFGPDDYGVHDGLVLEEVLVESLAQTVAAFMGLASVAAGRAPAAGMLVGVNDMRFHDEVPAGVQVVFEAVITRRLPPFFLADGKVTVADRVVAEGSMKFHITESDVEKMA